MAPNRDDSVIFIDPTLSPAARAETPLAGSLPSDMESITTFTRVKADRRSLNRIDRTKRNDVMMIQATDFPINTRLTIRQLMRNYT